MQGNGGRENHIRDVSLCELFGRIISAQTPECGNRRATARALADAGTRGHHPLRAQRDTGDTEIRVAGGRAESVSANLVAPACQTGPRGSSCNG